MRELRFSLECVGCGKGFARSVEYRPAATGALTLYCGHCGCANVTDFANGVDAERWSAYQPSAPHAVAADPPTVHAIPSDQSDLSNGG